MKVVIITPWFSENMGYAENKLPPALGKLNAVVHLISSDLQIYATAPEIYKVYEPFLGPPKVPVGTIQMDGYTLHRLPNYTTRYGIGVIDLERKLTELDPDVVYLFEINTEQTLQVINLQKNFRYRVYSESRLHLSVYKPPSTPLQKLKHRFTEYARWKKVGRSFEKCYPVAPDVEFVITKYFGQDPAKCKLSSLAVDTDLFVPATTADQQHARQALRNKLNYADDDIVCLYTGRFTFDKGSFILAQAIDHLHRQGFEEFKGLFVGTGDEKISEQIAGKSGCRVHPFVHSSELVNFYQSADIGIWPKQESTSQLDAAACGLPIIISSKVEDVERVNGNGLTYDNESPEDLAVKIRSLSEGGTRRTLGEKGVQKIRAYYSWERMARSRLHDFMQN